MGYNHLIIFLAPLANLLLSELFFFKAKLFYFSLFLANFVIIFSIKKISGKKITEKNFFNFLILPVLFSNSLMVYSLLLSDKFLIQFLFIINFIFNFYYLKNIHLEKKEPDGNKLFFENLSSYGNFLIIFFTFGACYGLRSFLSFPIWILALAAAIIVILSVHETFWANKIKTGAEKFYVFLLCLVLTQIAWSAYFLPINHNKLGLIMAICYYILMGITKLSLRNNLNKKTIKLYLSLGLGGIILILITARWA